MSALPRTECDCAVCSRGCTSNPGWPTPGDAETLIDRGYARSLMLDWWVPDVEFPGRVLILAPAAPGHGARWAPDMPALAFFSGWNKGGCVHYVDGRCAIHEIKPRECAIWHHDCDRDAFCWDRLAIVREWNTERGRALVDRWRTLVDLWGPGS